MLLTFAVLANAKAFRFQIYALHNLSLSVDRLNTNTVYVSVIAPLNNAVNNIPTIHFFVARMRDKACRPSRHWMDYTIEPTKFRVNVVIIW